MDQCNTPMKLKSFRFSLLFLTKWNKIVERVRRREKKEGINAQTNLTELAIGATDHFNFDACNSNKKLHLIGTWIFLYGIETLLFEIAHWTATDAEANIQVVAKWKQAMKCLPLLSHKAIITKTATYYFQSEIVWFRCKLLNFFFFRWLQKGEKTHQELKCAFFNISSK